MHPYCKARTCHAKRLDWGVRDILDWGALERGIQDWMILGGPGMGILEWGSWSGESWTGVSWSR